MGKGRNARLRAKRALEASIGNLHLLAKGKARAAPLPVPPKPTDEEQALPKSLRKLLQLKELTQGQAQQAKESQPKASNAKQSTDKDQQGQPSTSGREHGAPTGGAGATDQITAAAAAITAAAPQPKGKKGVAGQDVLNPELLEQTAAKTLKAKKKEYLKRKKLKKKGLDADVILEQARLRASSPAPDAPASGSGKPGKAGSPQPPGKPGKPAPTAAAGITSKQPTSTAAGAGAAASKAGGKGSSVLPQAAASASSAGGGAAVAGGPRKPVKEVQKDVVKFGEVADRPPEINLKRKHWAGQVQEKSASERCKEVFLKQLQQAQQRMIHGDANISGGVPAYAAVAAGSRKKQKTQQESAEEKEALRLQIIEAYRATKARGHDGDGSGGGGGVSMQSLKELVGRNKARPASTYTLA